MNRAVPLLGPAEQPAALSKAVVGIVARSTGRGPTKARAAIAPDLITVILQDTHTKGERTLAANGEHALVRDVRLAHHRAMRNELVQVAEELTGRVVQSVLADHDPVLDLSVITIVLEPRPAAPQDGRTDAAVEAPAALLLAPTR